MTNELGKALRDYSYLRNACFDLGLHCVIFFESWDGEASISISNGEAHKDFKTLKEAFNFISGVDFGRRRYVFNRV